MSDINWKQLRQEIKIPEILIGSDGKPTTGVGAWKSRREEILALVQREMYGITPPPCVVKAHLIKEDPAAYSDKAVERSLEIILEGPLGTWGFPLTLVIPKARPLKAVFVNIAFMITAKDGSRHCPSCPIEEIIDEGFAIAIFDYTSVSSDDGDYSSGISRIFPREGETGWGKLGMWAYAMSRAADYLESTGEFSGAPLGAIGFSRLGKTSLWAGAQDTRFSYIFPFGSSTAGVAFTRRNRKQNMEELQHNHWYWFNGNFRRYNHNEDALPFDQHFVVAACAPRRLLTSVAAEDRWADVESEYQSCKAADEAYRLAGARGFSAPDSYPQAPAAFLDGDLAMGLRHGTHFLSRADWRLAFDFIEKGRN